MYNVGDVIIHKIFGRGKVIEVVERPNYLKGKKINSDCPIIKVEFDTPMRTPDEMDTWWCREDIKVREFADWSLAESSLPDEK